MSEPQGLRSERAITRKRFGQFLRMVVKLFLLVFVVAALLSPPDPLAFSILLVPGWILAFPFAYFLVYEDGYEVVQSSVAYRPGPLAGRTSVWFAASVLGLKIALTVFFEVAVPFALTRAESLFISIVVLVLSYVLVYQGLAGWFFGDSAR